MMDLEEYYRLDHPGHIQLEEILDYSKAHQQLTAAEREFCANYYAVGKEHIENRTLHTLRNKPWMKLNFRAGWNAIFGTLTEVFCTVCLNNSVINTKFRIPLNQSEQEQLDGQDLIATNPEWQETYNVQVKQLHLGSYDDLKIDEMKICRYDPEFVHRLVLADAKNLLLYHFDYSEFLNYYNKNKIIGGYLNTKNLKAEMKHFVSLTL